MRLMQSPRLYRTYQGIKNERWRARILDFFAGNQSLPLTYDPFFKFIFNPDRHADRLENFISSILGIRVKIKRILPVEDSLIDGETYLIMDLLVELEMLDEYFLIALDVFTKIPYAEDNKSDLHAWLSLLTTDNLTDAERNIRHYPWLEPIYQEIALLRRSPEEVIGMWSEALRILDENSLKYYVEELKDELDKEKLRIKEKDAALNEKDAEIAALKAQLEAQKAELQDQKN